MPIGIFTVDMYISFEKLLNHLDYANEELIDKYIALEKRGKKSEAERPMEGVCGRQTEYNMDRTGE